MINLDFKLLRLWCWKMEKIAEGRVVTNFGMELWAFYNTQFHLIRYRIFLNRSQRLRWWKSLIFWSLFWEFSWKRSKKLVLRHFILKQLLYNCCWTASWYHTASCKISKEWVKRNVWKYCSIDNVKGFQLTVTIFWLI